MSESKKLIKRYRIIVLDSMVVSGGEYSTNSVTYYRAPKQGFEFDTKQEMTAFMDEHGYEFPLDSEFGESPV